MMHGKVFLYGFKEQERHCSRLKVVGGISGVHFHWFYLSTQMSQSVKPCHIRRMVQSVGKIVDKHNVKVFLQDAMCGVETLDGPRGG